MYTKAVKYFSAISLNERIRFLRLLLRWQGSLWKLLWADFLWLISAYIGVTLLYRLYLIPDPIHKDRFENIEKYMNKVAGFVPVISFQFLFLCYVNCSWKMVGDCYVYSMANEIGIHMSGVNLR